MLLKPSLLLSILLFTFCLKAQTSVIKGHLTNFNTKRTNLVHVILNRNQSNSVTYPDSVSKYKLIQESSSSLNVTVDEYGNFQFSNLSPGWAELSFYTIGYPDYYNIYTILIEDNEVIHLKIDYPRKEGKKTNKTCPLCRKKNQTIPVIFGLLNNVTIKKIKQEKVLLEGSISRPYSPTWYCKRDNLYY